MGRLSVWSFVQLLIQFMSFRGRAGRTDFWMVFLATVAVWVILWLNPISFEWHPGNRGGTNLVIAVALIHAAMPIVLAAYTIRRLHDLDRPSWWALPCLLIPLSTAAMWTATGQSLLGSIVGTSGYDAAHDVLMVASTLVLASYLYLLSMKGHVGPNKYGQEATEVFLPFLVGLF
jgi:uncharacterized membrane protein YhaH (DUF805 family)